MRENKPAPAGPRQRPVPSAVHLLSPAQYCSTAFNNILSGCAIPATFRCLAARWRAEKTLTQLCTVASSPSAVLNEQLPASAFRRGRLGGDVRKSPSAPAIAVTPRPAPLDVVFSTSSLAAWVESPGPVPQPVPLFQTDTGDRDDARISGSLSGNSAANWKNRGISPPAAGS